MFSRDEMQRAIEDALKTMEGVALELYRRGREPLLEELEEARARNADMRTMLEQVTRERDEARADLARSVAAWESAGMQGRTAHDAMLALAKERDEARADAERYLADLRRCASKPYEHAKERAKAFRSGAEAMREACQQWFREHDESFELTVDACHDVIADMSIPEEP